MVRWSYLIIAFLCTASACPSDLQRIEICRIDVPNKLCHCAIGDDEYKKPLLYCNGFFAMSEAATQRVGARLAECKKLEEACEQSEGK